ncbi:MAG TPA: class I SAM-dependent methyltransferase [Vicinamibacterales bacterium]|nr:class I SAM-dependent methyltransferase [Vicinamibacterales bacterium]
MRTSPSADERLAERTIADFGEQWTRFTTNDGFYASLELLEDICEPLVPVSAFRDRRVVEIGSGTGRIVQMMLAAGAAHVTATEPSVAFDVLTSNLAHEGARVDCVRTTGDRLPPGLDADLVVAIGVLHHIPDPRPVVEAAFRALRPGGRILVWLYGREGNAAYLSLVTPVRALTTRLPPGPTLVLARVLSALFTGYIALSRVAPLPLRGYVQHVIGKFTPERRTEVIYDQLKPAYAKYYTGAEARALVEAGGFADVRLHHRHGYSWTVTGVRPADRTPGSVR